jgi:hypothetical protein
MVSLLIVPMHPYLRRMKMAGERVVRYVDDVGLLIGVCEGVELVEVVHDDGTVAGGLDMRVRYVLV